jgi:HK97 family phage major capsid protein
MKKKILFMALFAIVLGGAFCFCTGFNPLDMTFADFGTLSGLSVAMALPFATIEEGMNEYLKQIKENKELKEEEKAFAETIFKQIGKLLTYKELSDAEKLARIDNELAKFKDFKTADVKAMGDALQAQIDTMIKNIEDMKVGSQQKTVKNPIAQITDAIVELAKEMKSSGLSKSSKDIQLKTAIDMTLAASVTGQIPQAQREAGISYAPEQPLSLLNVVPVTTIGQGVNKLEWVEKTDEQGKPAFISEVAASPKRSWKSEVKHTDVKDLAVHSEFSKNILNDVEYFRSEVYRDLSTQMRLELEKGVYDGDGLVDNLKGILEYAQAWNNDGHKLKAGAEANVYDVIKTAATQIGKEHHNANVVMINNWTAWDLAMTKDSNNNYIIPPGSSDTSIAGLRVVITELIADNELLVCDINKVQLAIREDMNIELFDQHSDNATKRLVVVQAVMRAALKIKNTDAKAFVYCDDVAAAITALEVGTT